MINEYLHFCCFLCKEFEYSTGITLGFKFIFNPMLIKFSRLLSQINNFVMQQSVIYNFIKSFPYPFIVRHDRLQVYAQYPEMDYAVLWRYSVRCAFFGFIVGKFLNRPWTFALIAPLPLITHFLYNEWKLKQEGKYQELYRFQNWEVKKQISQIKEKEKQSKAIKQKNTELESKLRLKENYFGQKIVSTKQFVRRLPKQYF